jgi:splicing factor 1
MFAGQSRGYGFVHMSDEKSASLSREGLNGKMIDGRPLMVRVRNEQRGPGGGGGGGGGRSGESLWLCFAF